MVHYGSFETTFLRRMCERYGGPPADSPAGRAIKSAINLLSVILQIYFPTYSNGDLSGIWSASTALMDGAGPAAPHQDYLIRRVIHGRSVIMAHRMQAWLREGNAFFAVGALHLYGEQGVQGLLEKEGFRVAPMD